MPFITFIYKVGNNPTVYYGKYCCDYISDDHEGLDTEVRYPLVKAIKKFKGVNKIKINIGIMSFSSDKVIPTDSSKKEISCFNFYHNYNNDIYINGTKQ